MAATALLRSRTSRWILPAALVLCCAAQPASSQSPAVPQAAAAAPTRDLTRPQAQPSLTLDRDPILSPDAEEKPPVAGNAPAGPPALSGKQQGDRTLTKEGNGFVLRADVDEVLLPCTVVDDKGQLVTNLDRGDFQVWEDNVPQKIASFQHQDVPVSLGILVDNSGSMRDKRAAINDAALHLVRVSNPADAAFI
jgi:Ca-activated chloride channel homolog